MSGFIPQKKFLDPKILATIPHSVGSMVIGPDMSIKSSTGEFLKNGSIASHLYSIAQDTNFLLKNIPSDSSEDSQDQFGKLHSITVSFPSSDANTPHQKYTLAMYQDNLIAVKLSQPSDEEMIQNNSSQNNQESPEVIGDSSDPLQNSSVMTAATPTPTYSSHSDPIPSPNSEPFIHSSEPTNATFDQEPIVTDSAINEQNTSPLVDEIDQIEEEDGDDLL